MKKTTQPKLNPKMKTRRDAKTERKEMRNTAGYRSENGRHLITLDLGEGLFTALRVLAHVFNHPTPEDYALAALCDEAASLLPQVESDEAKAFVAAQTIDSRARKQQANPTREIVLTVPEKAYAIWHGCALRDGYDSIEHMILVNESSLCAQSPGDKDEKEYYAMFGLTPSGGMPNRPEPTLHPKRLMPLRIS